MVVRFRNEIISNPFQIDKLLSNIGGILGFYVGFSALTILEFWELLLDFMVLGMIKLSNKANCKLKPTRSNSKAKIEPFVTRQSSGEGAGTTDNDSENFLPPAFPSQIQNLAY